MLEDMRVAAIFVLISSLYQSVKGDAFCLQDEFFCGDGECINKSHACDETIHCKDLSDERQACEPLQRHSCPSGWLQCRYSGECISADWICDDTNDCKDHSDEVPCKDMTLPDHTWSDLSLLNPAQLSLKQLNETFDDFGKFVGKKLRAIGIPKAMLVERLINELLFLAQLGFIDEDSFFCNSKGKSIF